MKNVLFVGGGSVGHIAPGVAVAKALQSINPNLQPHFICSKRKEDAEYLEQEGFPYSQIDAPRLSLLYPIQFFKARRQALSIIDQCNPVGIFSKGGYVSVPACSAAKSRKLPIVLHESDAVSGYANRLVARIAQERCYGFPIKQDDPHSHHTGNPVRPEVTEGLREEGLKITGFSGEKPILLVIGGSQGALSINQVIAKNAATLLSQFDIIHITGPDKHTVDLAPKGYWSAAFVSKELPHFYACADLALSRAGAAFISELAANKIPSVIVPLEGAAHDHQVVNAERLAEKQACIVLKQADLDAQLLNVIGSLYENEELRISLAESISTFHHPDAAIQIAKIIVQSLDHEQAHT